MAARARPTVEQMVPDRLGGAGGVVVQPVLGRAADVWGYGGSYLLGAAVQLVAVPLVRRAGRAAGAADLLTADRPAAQAEK